MSHAISKSLLPEFDHEMANTRKLLERVPEGIGDFAPHPKSMTLARLAGHIAEFPRFAIAALTTDGEIDLNPVGGEKLGGYHMHSKAEALARFDHDLTQARAALAGTSDERMADRWTLKSGGHTIFTLPRAAAVRGFIMSHMIHHRGQLGVYLRLNDVAVPGLYGPSADEQ